MEKCVFKSLKVHFKIGVFFIVVFKRFFKIYILDTSLFQTCDLQIFPPANCVFIFLIVFLKVVRLSFYSDED